jgi:hypothetical protein
LQVCGSGCGLRLRGGGGGEVGGGSGGDWEGGYERAGLGQGAGENCAESELVGVAVLAGGAGDFNEGAVGAVGAAGGEGGGYCWEEGGLEGGPASAGLVVGMC